MGKKYLNEIVLDEWDTILGDQSIYQENEEELIENKTFTVTIIQPSNAVIEVVVNGDTTNPPNTTTFTAKWDDTYTVRFQNGYNPDNLILNAIQGKITRDITIRAYDANLENKHENLTVNIVQSDNQTISVLHNGIIKTNSFTAQKYDYFSANVEAIEGYTPGRLSKSSGSIRESFTLSATPATKNQENYKTITLTQTSNQTITVTYNGKKYTNSFTAPVGAIYSVTIKANEGYLSGTIIDSGSGVVYGDETITATPAIIKTYSIYIIQSANQTITVDYNGTKYTSNISFVPYGTQLSATLKPNDGYNACKINATSYKVISDFTFKCTSNATVKYFTLTLPATTNQTITLKYKLPGESSFGHTTTSTSSSKNISLPYNTQWQATVAAATDYNPGNLNISSGKITANTKITISAAILDMYTLTIKTPTNGYIVVEVDGVQTTYRSATTIKVKKNKNVNVYAVANTDYKCNSLTVS